ncbi:MAG: transposase [Spirochaetales bacterium]|jgi:hypothetical protein|nr:transposase [Spirochaetales bacterium]
MYRDYAERMNSSGSPAERKKIVEEMCRMFAFSAAKAYKVLKESGWMSGRKIRRDAGTSALTAEVMDQAAALIRNGLRKNGKSTMPVTVARKILLDNGADVPLGNSRLRQLLREAGMTAENAKAAPPHQRMRSLYPNHVHFADPSLSLLYFAPGGKQRILRDDEAYKNKPFLEGKEDLKCWRYVLTDHYSASVCVRYYAARGETAVNMYDFLLYAWGRKDNPAYVFHGLPELLCWDKGSGNINKPAANALAALRVRTETHAPGNPRAKGQVEEANNLVETHFECLLKLEEVRSIEELNAAAERWCAAWNANGLSNFDSRLRRGGKIIGSRNWLWNRITAEQLRELPEAETCRAIFTTGIQVRRVAGDLTVSIVHPRTRQPARYSLARMPGIMVGQEVNVQPVLVDPEPVAAVSYRHQGEIISMEITPIAYEENGFDLRGAVFGKEYKRQPETAREQNAKRLDAIAASGAGGKPFALVTGGEGFKTHSLIRPEASPFIKQRTGEQITVAQPERVEIHDILISHFEAARQVKARNGWLSESFIGRMKAAYPEGAPSSLIDDIARDEAGAQDAAQSI